MHACVSDGCFAAVASRSDITRRRRLTCATRTPPPVGTGYRRDKSANFQGRFADLEFKQSIGAGARMRVNDVDFSNFVVKYLCVSLKSSTFAA